MANRVYAIVENENGGVFATDDAGATWKRVSEDRRLRQRRVLLLADLCRSEGQGHALCVEHRLL